MNRRIIFLQYTNWIDDNDDDHGMAERLEDSLEYKNQKAIEIHLIFSWKIY